MSTVGHFINKNPNKLSSFTILTNGVNHAVQSYSLSTLIIPSHTLGTDLVDTPPICVLIPM